MPLRRANRFWRSLRTRLTLWNTFVVLITVIVALIGVREGLRYYLVQELDDVLDDEVKELVLAIVEFNPDEQEIIDTMRRKSEVHAVHGWHIRWLNEDRSQTLWVSEQNAPDQPLSKLELESNNRSIWVSDTYRAIERKVEAPGVPVTYVRVGSMLEQIERDVGRMTQIMLPVGFAIFLLAPVGGFFLANRAIDPLQKIISTTERLRPSHFDERLTIRGVDDELDQLAQKINQFLDEIADHLTKHREFLANAAHELRSPLAAIQSSVDVALQQTRSSEDYQELLYSIEEQCHFLGQLVNQVLELAASDAGVVEDRRVPARLDLIANQSCDMFGAVADERGIKLQVQADQPVIALGDPQQLRQLVTNLIDNAIKFTPRGGSIQLRVNRLADQKQAELTVRDSGVGISAQDLPRIFDRFYRADKSRHRGTDDRGSGLGLSICQSIVHGHHGTIDVKSELGRGTTFRVLLPDGPTKKPGPLAAG